MKRYLYYSLLGLLALGCQRAEQEQPIAEGKGALKIELRLNNGVEDQTSKATVQDPYQIATDELVATVLQGEAEVCTWNPMSSMPPVVYFEAGQYTLQINTRGDRQAVNTVPYYFGQTPFTITAGRVSSIYAAASLQSMVVSMSLTGGWAAMRDYKLTYFALDKPKEPLFLTTDRAARLYIDNPIPYGVKVEGRVGGVSQKPNVLVYDNLNVGTYHNLTLSDQ